MRDAEGFEIGRDVYRVVESEAGVQLKTICGLWSSGHICCFSLGMGIKGVKHLDARGRGGDVWSLGGGSRFR